MNIDGSTRLIGLIGNPVEHTLSPVIHNGISGRMGIASVYVPFKVSEDGVADAVRGAYELNILGMNVTVPHKNRVIDSLVDIDEGAKMIGAVNTLVRADDKHGYKGYNTDYLGLKRQIHEDGIALKGRTVVILGAGGAAKAVVYMCLTEGARKVYLLNRTVYKACDIADTMNKLINDGYFTEYNHICPDNDIAKAVSNESIVVPMKLDEYTSISETELVVFQATSIGLSPNVDDVVIEDCSFYDKISVGVDLIYNPANTAFMQLITKHGGSAYNALRMLLFQGVIAYELWHNIEVPDNIIEDIYVDLKRRVYPKDNIVLIGFMGSGKTTIGKALAQRLHMNFLDTDEYIEKSEGMTIPEIFEKKGEEEFRRIETETLKRLRDTVRETVFSTGGGMPLRTENARLLKEIGRVFYLTAANQVIYDRVKEDTGRPLLQGEDPYGRICALMKERAPLYTGACDAQVDTNNNDIDEIVGTIESYL